MGVVRVQLTGVLLGLTAALCWGLADFFATLASRHLGTYNTVLASQIVGTLVLGALGVMVHARMAPGSFSWTNLLIGGVATGALAAIAYTSFYRGLAHGPIAVVSPVVASYGVVTVFLSVILLRERIDFVHGALTALILTGIALASTNFADLRTSLRDSNYRNILGPGMRAGLIALLSFGLLLFAIGAMSDQYGWFLPIFWARFFASVILGTLALMLSATNHGKALANSEAPKNAHKGHNAAGLFLTFAAVWRSSRTNFGKMYASLKESPHTDILIKSLHVRMSWIYAVAVGIVDTVGFVAYSVDTQIAPTAIAAAISSTYTLIPVMFGMLVFKERLATNQLIGVGLVVIGIILLATVAGR